MATMGEPAVGREGMVGGVDGGETGALGRGRQLAHRP